MVPMYLQPVRSQGNVSLQGYVVKCGGNGPPACNMTGTGSIRFLHIVVHMLVSDYNLTSELDSKAVPGRMPTCLQEERLPPRYPPEKRMHT
jgi:hypothetical protein